MSLRPFALSLRSSLFALFAALAASRPLLAQDRGAAALDQLVRGLSVTTRALMIGAHPDDENTQLLAFLARGRGVEAAYLSLTRGDGGQNLIGNELGEALGAIRTEELLAARRLDGARQFFTRAYDFGFSKSAEETFKHWDHEQVLGDVVTVIRAFRPHVILAVFSGTPQDGHGHHQVSGIVAREAYAVAGDTVRFPVAKFGRPWEPMKLYRGGGRGGGGGGGGGVGAGGGGAGGGRGDVLTLPSVVVGAQPGAPGGVSLNVGEFDPVLGRSYAEIAGESRGLHRSQGLGGAAQRKGPVFIFPQRERSRVNESTPPAEEKSLFDGIDTSLARLALRGSPAARSAIRSIVPLLDSARAALDLRRPEILVPWLARAAAYASAARGFTPSCANLTRLVRSPGECDAAGLDADASLEILRRRSAAAALLAAGVAVEAIAPQELLAFGDSMPIAFAVHNRGREPVALVDFRISGAAAGSAAAAAAGAPGVLPGDGITIAPDGAFRATSWVGGLVDTRPWWLGGRAGGDMFPAHWSPLDGLARVALTPPDTVPGVALPEDIRRESNVSVTMRIAGATFGATIGPIIRDTADALLGRQSRPAGGVPAITLEFDRGLMWIPAGRPVDRRLRLTLKSFAASPRTFSFRVVAPEGIRVDSVPRSVTLQPKEQREIFLRLRGSQKAGRSVFGIAAITDAGSYFEGFTSIEYPHIKPLRLYKQSAMYLQAVEVSVPSALTVAYIQGVGDVIAPFLRDLGIPTTVLNADELAIADLSRFSTVVVGTRAFQAHRQLVAYNARLLDFAKAGGTLVVQYGQNEMTTPGLLPYPIQRVGARVTVEEAPVTVTDPKARVLNWPNRIGEKDWAEWVQERALYMPATIDPRFATPLEMHDPGEPENKGALLVAPLGKGTYVYTTLALFRQIPGGVNGGPRLFVNLLSAGLERPPARRVQP